jgi:hypothetical protein
MHMRDVLELWITSSEVATRAKTGKGDDSGEF